MAKKTKTPKVRKVSKPGMPTQRFIDIAEIKGDVVVMKDGTLRAVVIVSSINFALKSTDEQEAIISSYMQLLNSLDHPLQVVIQSRRMNIEKYLDALKEQEKKQQNELLKAQIIDYREFINQLVELGDIMSKRFFVVIPFDPLSDKQKGFFARFKEALSPVISWKLKEGEEIRTKTVNDEEQTLSFTITTISNPEYIAVAENIREQWKLIGVDVQINSVDAESLQTDVLKERAYDILLSGELLGFDPDPFYFWHSSQVDYPGYNLSLYSNRNASLAFHQPESIQSISNPC